MTRRDSALHASCAGGVVDLTALDDQEQVCAIRIVTLPYCPVTQRVLSGEYRELAIWEAVNDAAADLLGDFAHVRVTTVTVRPWQRWWRKTPAKRLMPSGPRSTTEGERR